MRTCDSSCGREKRGVRPGTVGRKKGADAPGTGGVTALFLL